MAKIVSCNALKRRYVPELTAWALVVPGDPDNADSLIGYEVGVEPASEIKKCSYQHTFADTKVCVDLPCAPLQMTLGGVTDKENEVFDQDEWDCGDFCNMFNGATVELETRGACDWGIINALIGSAPNCINEIGNVVVVGNGLITADISLWFEEQLNGDIEVYVKSSVAVQGTNVRNSGGGGKLILDTVLNGECKVLDERDPNWTIPFNIDQNETGIPCELEGGTATVTKSAAPPAGGMMVNYTRAFFEIDNNTYNLFFD
jgi:hypothetical protein